MHDVTDAPVGLWSGTVSHDGEVDEYTITFAENGSLTLTTKKSTGEGTWSSTGEGTFRYTVRETFNHDVGQRSPNGKSAAYLQIDIEAKRNGASFAGVGTAEVHGPDGSIIYATTAETAARQVPAA
jgi:hypothetical protein